jgi:hypothetical protein
VIELDRGPKPTHAALMKGMSMAGHQPTAKSTGYRPSHQANAAGDRHNTCVLQTAPEADTAGGLTTDRCINLRRVTRGGNHPWEFEKRGREINVRVEGQLAAEPDGVVPVVWLRSAQVICTGAA